MSISGLTYLDHNATTPMKPAALEKMQEMLGFPGNASAIHKAGRDARRRIEQARGNIAAALNAGARDVIVFTAGATEANNLALLGAGMERVIVSATEHPSVLNVRSDAEILPVDANGIVDVAALDGMLAGNTRQTLISVMRVNNETGVIQPIEEIVAVARKRGALVHSDCVQAFGKIPLDVQKLGADFVTLSAHKMGGPQGVGCLVICNCNPVAPMIRGGNQEKNIRSGTENLPAIVAFGHAATLIDPAEFATLALWRDKIETAIKSAAPEAVIFGANSPRIANTTMFALPGAPSETQLIALDLAGICVSNGSACSSGTVKPSHVLKAMGADDAAAGASLRVSLGWNTAEKDVDYFIAKWLEMYGRVQSRKKG
ncbi:MAG: cysteine desulfurase family protein [Alphaproteobacteria bacterium]